MIGTIIWKCYLDSLLQMTRTTGTTSIAWIEVSSILTIGTIVYILKRSYGNALRRLRGSGRSKAISEIITIIPVTKNKLGMEAAEVEKK